MQYIIYFLAKVEILVNCNNTHEVKDGLTVIDRFLIIVKLSLYKNLPATFQIMPSVNNGIQKLRVVDLFPLRVL